MLENLDLALLAIDEIIDRGYARLAVLQAQHSAEVVNTATLPLLYAGSYSRQMPA